MTPLLLPSLEIFGLIWFDWPWSRWTWTYCRPWRQSPSGKISMAVLSGIKR